MIDNRTSPAPAATRRFGRLLTGAVVVAAVALGQAGLAHAQPIDTTKKWDGDQMEACISAGIDRGAADTFEGFNGLIFDCCLMAGGNPRYDHGPNSTVTCPEAAARGSSTPPGAAVQQSGPPPVLAPPTPPKPKPRGGIAAPRPATVVK